MKTIRDAVPRDERGRNLAPILPLTCERPLVELEVAGSSIDLRIVLI